MHKSHKNDFVFQWCCSSFNHLNYKCHFIKKKQMSYVLIPTDSAPNWQLKIVVAGTYHDRMYESK